jgi:drug/metabolite transporter (DMT)-like permease
LSASRLGIVAALVALCAVWGYSWIAMKVALRHAHPFDFATHRLVLGALLMFGLVAATGRRLTLPVGSRENQRSAGGQLLQPSDV